ncbi:MAG: recombinase family protein [bacterium]
MNAAAYARYSTDKQCSIEVQFSFIQKYCDTQGLSLSPSQMYEDEALTGMRTRRRKGFHDLLRAAENHEFDCVVLYDLTRGSRDVVDWFTFRKDMKSLNIDVFSVMDRLGDLDNPNDFLTELITVGIGQTHVLTSRVKSMDKVDFLAKQGKFLGGYAPFGYTIKDGLYIIDEIEAEYVRKIFAMYASGGSYNEILDALPAGLHGKRGRPLGKNSLFEILRNERYIGRYTWCKRKVKYMSEWAGGGPSDRAVTIDDIIPPIIDRDTWEKVKKRMDANKHNTMNNSRRNREYLLTGLLRCGQCGAAFIGITTTNKKGCEYKFYSCVDKYRNRTCKSKNIPANDIEPLVVSLLRRSMLDGSMIEATADAILAAGNGKNSASQLSALKKELAELEAKINNLIDALAGGLNSAAVRDKLTEYEGNKRVLEQKIKELRPKPTLSREYLIKELSRDAERLQNSPDCIKELLQKYIVKIDVFDDAIIIHSTADLSGALPAGGVKLPVNGKIAGNNSDDLSADGCGGRI